MSGEMRKFASETVALDITVYLSTMSRAVGIGNNAGRESGESPEQYPLL